MRTQPPLVAPLFRTQGQASLLAVLTFRDTPLGLTDLADQAGVVRSSAYREVVRLADAGLLTIRKVGREWQVAADTTSPLVQPVRQILGVAFGPAVLLREELAALDGVQTAIIFGSFAARARGRSGPAPKDVDVLVIGTVDLSELYAAARRVGAVVGRPVNPTVMSASEWQHARTSRNAFARDVIANPVLPLIGSWGESDEVEQQAT